jgi:hypothetical protein
VSFADYYKGIKARLERTSDDAAKAEYELAQLYMATFNTVPGRKVLEHMLAELHFFDETVGEVEDIRRNYARRLLAIMGVWRPVNAEAIVENLLTVNWRKPFTTEDEKK